MKKRSFKVTHQEKKYQDSWLSLSVLETETDGIKGEYSVVHKSDCVTIILEHGDKILLLESYRYPLQKSEWEVVAGSIEKDESPLCAAQREVFEETGIKVDLKEIGSFHPIPGLTDLAAFVYWGKVDVTALETILSYENIEDEIIQRSLFSIAEVQEMIKNHQIYDGITITSFAQYMMYKRETNCANTVEENCINIEKTLYDRRDISEQKLSLVNYIFEQNKMQQEMKNTWFGHFLVIIGGVAAFATICLSLLEENANKVGMYIIAGGSFFLTGIIGLIFLGVFLYQRANYWKNYKLLNEIQIDLIESITQKRYDYFYPQQPFSKRKRGADYYVGLLERLLVTVCFVVALVFLLIGLSVPVLWIIVASFTLFLILHCLLQFSYAKFEKRNKL